MRFAKNLIVSSLWGLGSATFETTKDGADKWTYDLVFTGKDGKTTCKSKQGQNYAECAQFDSIRIDDFNVTLTLKAGDVFPHTEIRWGNESIQAGLIQVGKAVGEINSVLNLVPGNEWTVAKIDGFGSYQAEGCKNLTYLRPIITTRPISNSSLNYHISDFAPLTAVPHESQRELSILIVSKKMDVCDGGDKPCQCGSWEAPKFDNGTIVLTKNFTQLAHTLKRDPAGGTFKDWTDFTVTVMNLTGLTKKVPDTCATASLTKATLEKCLADAVTRKEDIHESFFLSTPEAEKGEVNIQGIRVLKDNITMTVPYAIVHSPFNGSNVYAIKFFQAIKQSWQGDERCNTVELYYLPQYTTPYSAEFNAQYHLGRVINLDLLRGTGDIHSPEIFTYAKISTASITLKPNFIKVHGVLPGYDRGTIMAVPVRPSENCQWTGRLVPEIRAFKLHVNRKTADTRYETGNYVRPITTGLTHLSIVNEEGEGVAITLGNALEKLKDLNEKKIERRRILIKLDVDMVKAPVYYNATYVQISGTNASSTNHVLNRAFINMIPVIPEIAKLEALIPEIRHTFSLSKIELNNVSRSGDDSFVYSKPDKVMILRGAPIIAPVDILNLGTDLPVKSTPSGNDISFEIQDRALARVDSSAFTVFALSSNFSEDPSYYIMDMTLASNYF